jgi:F0F1-type ATP synthase membrane subunit b/b'
MKQRHSDVFDGLSRSKLQAQSVAARKKDVEARLANLDAEKIQIADEWKLRAIEHGKSIQEGSVRVVAQMRSEAAQNKKALEVSLQGDILRTFRKNVLTQAESKIKQALNADVHTRVNQNFIQEAGKGASA